MGPWCAQMGVSGWATMIGLSVAVIALVVWALARMFPTDGAAANARAALDSRLATGEIDPETYRVLRSELDAGAPAARTGAAP